MPGSNASELADRGGGGCARAHISGSHGRFVGYTRDHPVCEDFQTSSVEVAETWVVLLCLLVPSPYSQPSVSGRHMDSGNFQVFSYWQLPSSLLALTHIVTAGRM